MMLHADDFFLTAEYSLNSEPVDTSPFGYIFTVCEYCGESLELSRDPWNGDWDVVGGSCVCNVPDNLEVDA